MLQSKSKKPLGGSVLQAFHQIVASVMLLDQLLLNILTCFLPQPSRKLSKETLKSKLLHISMDEEIFQLSQLFLNPAGTRVWQRYNTRERNNNVCFASGVNSVMFSVNNRDIRHTYHWSKVLLRKPCKRPNPNLCFYVFVIHCLSYLEPVLH